MAHGWTQYPDPSGYGQQGYQGQYPPQHYGQPGPYQYGAPQAAAGYSGAAPLQNYPQGYQQQSQYQAQPQQAHQHSSRHHIARPSGNTCYNCGSPQHWAQDCPEPRRQIPYGQVTQNPQNRRKPSQPPVIIKYEYPSSQQQNVPVQGYGIQGGPGPGYGQYSTPYNSQGHVASQMANQVQGQWQYPNHGQPQYPSQAQTPGSYNSSVPMPPQHQSWQSQAPQSPYPVQLDYGTGYQQSPTTPLSQYSNRHSTAPAPPPLSTHPTSDTDYSPPASVSQAQDAIMKTPSIAPSRSLQGRPESAQALRPGSALSRSQSQQSMNDSVSMDSESDDDDDDEDFLRLDISDSPVGYPGIETHPPSLVGQPLPPLSETDKMNELSWPSQENQGRVSSKYINAGNLEYTLKNVRTKYDFQDVQDDPVFLSIREPSPVLQPSPNRTSLSHGSWRGPTHSARYQRRSRSPDASRHFNQRPQPSHFDKPPPKPPYQAKPPPPPAHEPPPSSFEPPQPLSTYQDDPPRSSTPVYQPEGRRNGKAFVPLSPDNAEPSDFMQQPWGRYDLDGASSQASPTAQSHSASRNGTDRKVSSQLSPTKDPHDRKKKGVRNDDEKARRQADDVTPKHRRNAPRVAAAYSRRW